MHDLQSPTGTNPQHLGPPHFPLITHHGKIQSHATPFCIAVRLWSIVSLAFWETISPWNHLVLPLLFPWPVLVIVPHQYGDSFSWGSKDNTRVRPKLVVIRWRRAEAGWEDNKCIGVIGRYRTKGISYPIYQGLRDHVHVTRWTTEHIRIILTSTQELNNVIPTQFQVKPLEWACTGLE